MGILAWLSIGYIKPIKKMAVAPRSQITRPVRISQDWICLDFWDSFSLVHHCGPVCFLTFKHSVEP